MSDLPRRVDVAIIGAGFGGLGAAIEMQRAGFSDFAVLERAPEVGGTWFYNSYPGCQCDVPSNLYSYSFAKRPDWPRSYSEQPEILAYLKDCSHRFGVRDRFHFGCEVTQAHWDDGPGRWEIETSRGPVSARVLVAATGLLSQPRIPDIPGLDTFPGQVVHTARWGDGQDYTGRRVAVVGTGATAIQLVPHLQEQAESLVVFQRTPPWVLPLLDRPVGRWLQKLYARVPATQDAARALVYGLREPLVVPLAFLPKLTPLFQLLGKLQLRRQVKDPALRRRLTPDYVIGCKRILLSNRWYRALTARNVTVVTEGLERVDGEHPGRLRRDAGPGGRAGLRDRLHAHRAADRPPPPRERRSFTRRGVVAEAGGLPRLDGGGLPEPVPDLRAERQPRAQLDDLHARVAVPLPAARAAGDAGPPAADPRDPAGGPARLQPRGPAAARRHGLERGPVRELVPRQQRREPDHVGRLHLPVPAGSRAASTWPITGPAASTSRSRCQLSGSDSSAQTRLPPSSMCSAPQSAANPATMPSPRPSSSSCSTARTMGSTAEPSRTAMTSDAAVISEFEDEIGTAVLDSVGDEFADDQPGDVPEVGLALTPALEHAVHDLPGPAGGAFAEWQAQLRREARRVRTLLRSREQGRRPYTLG